jgi:4-hydroxybenzoate polyprenyltransferase
MAEAVPTPGRWSSLRLAARDIKLAHSVFALPFALLAGVLAWDPGSGAVDFAGQLTLIILCMIFARTWAMLFNRIVDREFDAGNPRTARRALASGALSPRQAWSLALAAAALFITSCAMFWLFFANPWPLALALPTLAWIAFYSLTKRFTALCHLFLGGALAASPLAAAIAIRPEAIADTPALWWLAAMVLAWVAGFDVIYALQDIDFDRSTGLRSVPARLGPRGAAWVSRALHLAALAALVIAWRTDTRLDAAFLAAVIIVAAVLAIEHAVLARRGQAGIPVAFFTCNGIVACAVGALGIIDVFA